MEFADWPGFDRPTRAKSSGMAWSRADLGRDEHVITLDAGRAQRFAVLLFVAVMRGGVEMTIADLQARLSPPYTPTSPFRVMVPRPICGIRAPWASTNCISISWKAGWHRAGGAQCPLAGRAANRVRSRAIQRFRGREPAAAKEHEVFTPGQCATIVGPPSVYAKISHWNNSSVKIRTCIKTP